MNRIALLIAAGLWGGMVSAAEIEPTWESLAANYPVIGFKIEKKS